MPIDSCCRDAMSCAHKGGCGVSISPPGLRQQLPHCNDDVFANSSKSACHLQRSGMTLQDMNPLWFCTTASLIALCAICLVTKVYKELRFYSGMQALFALLALLFIWAYYSPRVSQTSYEELFWWKQHFTQASEIVLCVYL